MQAHLPDRNLVDAGVQLVQVGLVIKTSITDFLHQPWRYLVQIRICSYLTRDLIVDKEQRIKVILPAVKLIDVRYSVETILKH